MNMKKFQSVVLFILLFRAFFLPEVFSHSSHRRHITKDSAPRFRIADDKFWKDNEPFRIIGGDVHYFRIPSEYWEDRLLKAKALGLNTIQTYIPWNLHEPQPQKFAFEGWGNVEGFLQLAHKLGFLVMLRVGPYICGEWDLGGFPHWLLDVKPAIRLRSSDTAFLMFVERWWGTLLPKIVPLLYDNGGPVIMVQIENEYGSFGDDKTYLRNLVNLARRYVGDDIILYTTDGGSEDLLQKGTIMGLDVFSAIDFSTGVDPQPIFELQKKYNPPGKSPPLSSEFYTGWLTHWGEKIASTGANWTAAALDNILSKNASVVLYMGHGGTNFGFFSGANTGQDASVYQPDLTSYDYDAPIQESGDVHNPKYEAMRSVIRKYSRYNLPPVPADSVKRAYGNIKMQRAASLFEVLNIVSEPIDGIQSNEPIPMESFVKMIGFSLYLSTFRPKRRDAILSIPLVHDRAQIFILCKSGVGYNEPSYIGTIERWQNRNLTIPSIGCSSNVSLYILVENMGRVNYGPFLYDKKCEDLEPFQTARKSGSMTKKLKGILSSVLLDDYPLHKWKTFPISFDRINDILDIHYVANILSPESGDRFSPKFLEESQGILSTGPRFHVGHLMISETDEVKDTYISFRGWNKGVFFVNGFNVGRFWPSVGPQCNLYVPAPLLKHGENILILLELEEANPTQLISSVSGPDFTCGPQNSL